MRWQQCPTAVISHQNTLRRQQTTISFGLQLLPVLFHSVTVAAGLKYTSTACRLTLLWQAPTTETSHIRQINWHKKRRRRYCTITPHNCETNRITTCHDWDESNSLAYYRMSEKLRVGTPPSAILFVFLLCPAWTAQVGLSQPYEVPSLHSSSTRLGCIPLDEWSARRKRPLPDNKQSQENTQSLQASGLRPCGHRVRYPD
jgi:hypothetical protein